PCRRERGPDHRTATFVVHRVRSAGHEGRSPSGGGTPLPGAISPAETGEIRARGEARRSEADQSILQGMVRFGDVNVANKRCTTSWCSKAIIPGGVAPPRKRFVLPHCERHPLVRMKQPGSELPERSRLGGSGVASRLFGIGIEANPDTPGSEECLDGLGFTRTGSSRLRADAGNHE